MVVEFALALMSVLDQINRESFQRFRLRIGLNHGPVIAGVIGAQKPQYVYIIKYFTRHLLNGFPKLEFIIELNWGQSIIFFV